MQWKTVIAGVAGVAILTATALMPIGALAQRGGGHGGGGGSRGGGGSLGGFHSGGGGFIRAEAQLEASADLMVLSAAMVVGAVSIPGGDTDSIHGRTITVRRAAMSKCRTTGADGLIGIGFTSASNAIAEGPKAAPAQFRRNAIRFERLLA